MMGHVITSLRTIYIKNMKILQHLIWHSDKKKHFVASNFNSNDKAKTEIHRSVLHNSPSYVPYVFRWVYVYHRPGSKVMPASVASKLFVKWIIIVFIHNPMFFLVNFEIHISHYVSGTHQLCWYTEF